VKTKGDNIFIREQLNSSEVHQQIYFPISMAGGKKFDKI